MTEREVRAYGMVEAGKLKITKRQDFYDGIQNLNGRVEIIVRKIYPQRSLDQNAYFHGILLPEFQNALIEAGWDKRQVTKAKTKKIIKQLFLTEEIVNEQTGEIIEVVNDTHSLTTTEFAVLIDDAIKWCAEKLSYEIPYPNEQATIF